MNKRLKLNGLLSLVLVLSLLMSMPVRVLADEPDENNITVEETPEETTSDTVEEVPGIICEPVEPAVEEAGEGLLSEAAVEVPVTDETIEIADAAEDIPLEGISDMDETASDFTDEQPTEPQEETDEILLDDPVVEALVEDDVADELRDVDVEKALDGITIEATETTMEPVEEEELNGQEGEEILQPEDAVEEPFWSLSLPGSQPIAYKAERTEIGTISVQGASNFTDDQAISVTLDYSSFSSDTHSIPIEITVMQNGTERTWSAGTGISLSPDGSDPITVFVNISAEAWAAAPHGAYAMSLRIRSALAGR